METTLLRFYSFWLFRRSIFRQLTVVFCLGLVPGVAYGSRCSWLLAHVTGIEAKSARPLDPTIWIADNLKRNFSVERRGAPHHESPAVIAEVEEAVRWMTFHLQVDQVNPLRTLTHRRLLHRIRDFAKNLTRTGQVNWDLGITLAVDFSHLMGAQRPWNPYKPFRDADRISRQSIDQALSVLRPYHGFITSIFTARSVSIPVFNDLSPFPVFVNQMVAARSAADNIRFRPLQYLGHDLAVHNIAAFQVAFQPLLDALLAGKIGLETFQRYVEDRARNYALFREFVASQKTDLEKEVLELIWFTLFHEADLDHIDHHFEFEISRRAILNVLSLTWPHRTGPLSSVVTKRIYDRIHQLKSLSGDQVERSQFTAEALARGVSSLLQFVREWPADHRGELDFYLHGG